MATIICHPDKVNESFKKIAQKIFIDLKLAYDTNNLTKVNSILEELEIGNFFKDFSENASEKDLLKTAIATITKQIGNLNSEIDSLKHSQSFKTIVNIDDWDIYFAKTKASLQKELNKLKQES